MIDRIPNTGPNPARSRFFLDVAAGMQFLALFYTLTAKEQDEVINHMHSFAATGHEAEEKEKR